MNTEKKIEKEYIVHCFGFPVKLNNAPFVLYRGEWMLDIPMGYLSDKVASILATRNDKFNGKEIRFIRLKFNKNSKEFCDLFQIEPEELTLWEKKQYNKISMNPQIEKKIRSYILDSLSLFSQKSLTDEICRINESIEEMNIEILKFFVI